MSDVVVAIQEKIEALQAQIDRLVETLQVYQDLAKKSVAVTLTPEMILSEHHDSPIMQEVVRTWLAQYHMSRGFCWSATQQAVIQINRMNDDTDVDKVAAGILILSEAMQYFPDDNLLGTGHAYFAGKQVYSFSLPDFSEWWYLAVRKDGTCDIISISRIDGITRVEGTFANVVDCLHFVLTVS